MSVSSSEMSRLLAQWRDGDAAAFDRLMPLVYPQLRLLAEGYLRRERRDHTLQPTAVVHEAYLKMIGRDHPNWADRVHFFAVAARIMRRILVDHARARRAAKRGGHLQVTWTEGGMLDLELSGSASASPADVIDLDEALRELAQRDARKARTVELRYFGGLTVEEVAQVLKVSKETVYLDSRLARAWLQDRLSREGVS
ncbi:MAG: sigma-70 family RNA polymerase sigma factor [Deltaproteobacteria bacterium]|nr:sigma-70 family RNA polymerase sigma factor [Deltaproteobacteria bacterium]